MAGTRAGRAFPLSGELGEGVRHAGLAGSKRLPSGPQMPCLRSLEQ